jgi:Holliday junction resolvasome, endonuclease subunit
MKSRFDFILGFDPSLNGCGYCVLDVRNKRPKIAEKGTVRGKNKTWGEEDTTEVKLGLIYHKACELVLKYRPTYPFVFLERGHTKFNTATQSVFRARGALQTALIGFEIVEYTPTSVKKLIAEHGGATKGTVAESVATFLGRDITDFQDEKGKLEEDQSDATAVALMGYLKHYTKGEF